jgi:hypothetical protein
MKGPTDMRTTRKPQKRQTIPMNLVAADVRRLIPFCRDIRASLRRLLRFKGSTHGIVRGIEIFIPLLNIPLPMHCLIASMRISAILLIQKHHSFRGNKPSSHKILVNHSRKKFPNFRPHSIGSPLQPLTSRWVSTLFAKSLYSIIPDADV